MAEEATLERPRYAHYRDFSKCTESILKQSVDILWVRTGQIITTKELAVRVTPYGLVTEIDGVPKAVIDGEILWTEDDNSIVPLIIEEVTV